MMDGRTYWLAAVALILVAAGPNAALAGDGSQKLQMSTDRPGAADGTSTVQKGHFQVETGVNASFEAESSQVNFADTLLRYGFSDTFELRLFTAPFGVSSRSAAGSELRPLGSLTLSGKFSYDFGDAARVAVIPFASLQRAASPGRSWSGGVRLAADIGLQRPVGMTFNLGVSAVEKPDETAGSEVFTSVVANISIAESIGSFVEVYTVSPPTVPMRVYADAGVTWALNARLQVDGWLGFEFTRPGSQSTGLGVSYLF